MFKGPSTVMALFVSGFAFFLTNLAPLRVPLFEPTLAVMNQGAGRFGTRHRQLELPPLRFSSHLKCRIENAEGCLLHNLLMIPI